MSPVLVPNRLVFCLLPSRVYDCDQSTNPYVFGFGQQAAVAETSEEAEETTTEATTAPNPIQSDDSAQASTTATTAASSGETSTENDETAAARNKIQEKLNKLLAEQKNKAKIKSQIEKSKETINKVRKITCTLNGIDLDGLSSPCLDEIAFFRMNKFLGFHSTTSSNSISLEEFKNGSTMYIFDFSTSLNSGRDFLIPSLKTGHLRASISFSKNTEEPLHLLVLSEYNSNLSIGGTAGGARTVSSNYFI